MNSGHLDDLKQAFLEASCLHDDARIKFIESLKNRDLAPAQELEKLLVHDIPTDHDLSDIVNAVESDLDTDQNRQRVGQTLGPYELIEHIGQGSMGAAYRAERNDGEFDIRSRSSLLALMHFRQT